MRRRRAGASLSAVEDRWRSPGSGLRYRDRRWRTARAEQRDLRLVQRILARHGVEPSPGGILDAPCGTGRLRPVLEAGGRPYVGVDVSAAMLEGVVGAPLVRASVASLPFQDNVFDVVVSCRLLHHLQDERDLTACVHELTRVSHRLVVVSFWDSASLHAWRRRVGLRRELRPEGRHAVRKRVLRRLFEEAGAEVVGFHHSFRFVSQQTFLVARKRARALRPAVRAAHVRDTLPAPSTLGAEGALGQA